MAVLVVPGRCVEVSDERVARGLGLKAAGEASGGAHASGPLATRLEWSAARAGLEATPVQASLADLLAQLASGGPAIVLPPPGPDGERFLVVESARRQRVTLLAADGRRGSVAPGELREFFKGWELLWEYEGPSRDPAHRRPVAELVARRKREQ